MFQRTNHRLTTIQSRWAIPMLLGVFVFLGGCRVPQMRKVDRFLNPTACPSCAATTADLCVCFPHDVAAGYHETIWNSMEEPLPPEYSEHVVQEVGPTFLEIEPIPLPKE